MSLHTKLMIPLLDPTFSKEDLSKDAGFVDVFTKNINRPYLDKNIFFLYKANDLTPQSEVVFAKFRKSPSFVGFENIRVDNKPYRLYTFSITGNSLNKLYTKHLKPSSIDDLVTILKYWNVDDKEINNCILGTFPYVDADETSVPEQDYAEII